jgi:hypothetical protein
MNQDFWDGIESNFPLCCIIFYMDFWNPKMFSGRPECYDWQLNLSNTNVDRVMCPECIIKKLREYNA